MTLLHSTRRDVVLVLGMHRSGTSALTRVISLWGARLPDDQIVGDENNPDGYFEPARLNALNDRLLAMAGSSWDDFRPLDLGHLPEGAIEGFREQIAAELAGQFGTDALIVVKDPRVARMAGLYAEAVARIGAAARFVIPVRRPSAVAQSLHRRDGTTTAYAGLLWLRHVLDAEAATRGAPRSIFASEELIDDWRKLAQRLSGDLGIAWPSAPEGAAEQVEGFLRRGSWRGGPPPGPFPVEGPLGRMVDEAYAAVLELAGAPAGTPALFSRLDALRSRLDAAGPDVLSAAMDEMRSQRGRQNAVAADLSTRASAASGQIDALRAERERDREQAGRDAEISAAAVAAAEARAEQSTERMALVALERARIEQDLAEARGLLASTVDRLAERDRRIEAQDRDLSALTAEIAQIKGMTAAADAAHAATRQALGEQLATASAEAADLRHHLASLEREVAERVAAGAQLETRLLEQQASTMAATAAAEASAQRLADLEAEHEASASLARRSQQRLERAQSALAGLDTQIAEKDRDIARLGFELGFVRQQLNAEASSSQAEIARLQGDFVRLEVDHRHAWTLVEEAHRSGVGRQRILDEMRADLGRLQGRPLSRLAGLVGLGQRAPRLSLDLVATPTNQAETQDREDGIRRVTMTGDDPSLALTWPGDRPLPHGFYELSFPAPAGLGALIEPKLYVDTGAGFNEDEAILLTPFEEESGRFVARFGLHPYTVALRLDPSTSRGWFDMGAVQLRTLSKLAYYSSLGARLLADRRRRDGSIWPSVRRALGTLRREGLGPGLRTLRARGLSSVEAQGGAPRLLDIDVQPVYVPKTTAAPLADPMARVIAFYLPQFHPIPLNDKAWGEGFTEWSNVRPAQPQFVGHYQPHVPDELGYYDLRDPGVQRQQVDLARLYGIGGFCFYFYWFGGERILETPILNYLADESLDLPFCLCWANENWSRRWDGLESEILIAQQHSADDDLAFIAYVAKYMRDPRYIRINGKPLLVVYRPNLLPDMAATARRWRAWCRENGIGEIHLSYTQSFEGRDPREYGLNSAIEFPPNNSSPPDLTTQAVALTPDFSGKVYDWSIFPERSRNYSSPAYTLFRSVNPGWDNTARRKGKGTIFANATPAGYREWLGNALVETRSRLEDPSERLVFVNAWNEWAEGAHLEPDRRYGFAWLDATRQALETASKTAAPRIVIVIHDAHPHGAQLLALHACINLRQMGVKVDIIALEGGELLGRFAEAGTVHPIDRKVSPEDISALLQRLWAKGASSAIVNTTVAGSLAGPLKAAGFKIVSLIHELPAVLSEFRLKAEVQATAEHADAVVFPAEMVRTGFEGFAGQHLTKAHVRPQGSYLASPYRFETDLSKVRARVRSALNLPPDARIILSAGYADRRKGLDLFVAALIVAMRKDPRIHGVWIGHADTGFLAGQQAAIASAGLTERFRFPGRIIEPQDYYAAADVYALTSREDPFPSVVMEALDVRVPVVMFAGTGGAEVLLSRGAGLTVPAFDTAAYAQALLEVVRDDEARIRMGNVGHDIVLAEFSFREYLFDLLELAGEPLPKVSVIVPNYNYAQYIEARLRSIEDQRLAVYEIIVLDDASSDDSVERIGRWLGRSPLTSKLVVNETNSGSVFRQWAKGVALAKGDYVWIAEADDLSDPDFLETALAPLLADPATVMSYTQSKMIDGEGQVTAPDYLGYVAELGAERWQDSYVAEGAEEVAAGLYLKNTVPNVSAAVFRREALAEMLEAHLDEIAGYRNAGDWVAYLKLMERGKIAFSPKVLNAHRRHTGSVTLGNANVRHLREIMAVQREAIARHGLGEEAEAAALAYAQRIYEQFGLATDEHPRVEMHPDLLAAPIENNNAG